MNTQIDLRAVLLEVRAYLAQEAQAEDFRNEAAWEAGSSREEEHAASDALIRLDDVLRQIKTQQRPSKERPGQEHSGQEHSGQERSAKDGRSIKEDRAQSRGHERVRLHHTELAA